jgi:hypothetical protein
MRTNLRLWWQKIRKPLGVVGIIVTCVLVIGLIVAIIGGYHSNWEWTGFGKVEGKTTTTWITPGTTTATRGTSVATETQPPKTLWDWLGLLAILAIPVVVGFGVAWFTAQQGKVGERENKDNQREKALQDYIDKMSELLLKEHLGELLPDGKADQKYRQQQNGNIKGELKPEYEQVCKIARVRTLTILSRLDGHRKRSVLQFLHGSGLISKGQHPGAKSIVDLSGADLSEADLSGVKLLNVDLWEADLSGADLRNTWWKGVELWDRGEYPPKMPENPRLPGPGVRLPMQHYSKVRYPAVDLSGANLSGAKLINADLSGADLSGAYMSGVNLSGANLKGVFGDTEGKRPTKSPHTGHHFTITTTMKICEALENSNQEGLNQLKGTIMPNGSKHP